MGMLTHSTISIDAPAAEVFAWLIEPAKLTQWLGAAGAMPEDTTLLRAGFTATASVAALDGGEAKLTVDSWDPPHGYAVTTTYPGGDSRTVYRLTESAGRTTLDCESDTDWGKPDLSPLEQSMAGQSAEVQAAMRQAIESMESQVASGAYDSTTQNLMQSSLDQSMAKLKQLIEAE